MFSHKRNFFFGKAKKVVFFCCFFFFCFFFVFVWMLGVARKISPVVLSERSFKSMYGGPSEAITFLFDQMDRVSPSSSSSLLMTLNFLKDPASSWSNFGLRWGGLCPVTCEKRILQTLQFIDKVLPKVIFNIFLSFAPFFFVTLFMTLLCPPHFFRIPLKCHLFFYMYIHTTHLRFFFFFFFVFLFFFVFVVVVVVFVV